MIKSGACAKPWYAWRNHPDAEHKERRLKNRRSFFSSNRKSTITRADMSVVWFSLPQTHGRNARAVALIFCNKIPHAASYDSENL
jgi:hypothetical protein